MSSDIVVRMQLAQKYLYQNGGAIVIFIGTIGCVLNLIVFTQKTLRKNPCSIYFIAHNFVNFVFIYASLLPTTLSLGYSIDYTARNLVLCRVRLYITILSNVLSPLYLVFASIDRVLITSSNARTRQRSTRRLAYICIAIGTLFWTLLHSPILFLANIIPIGPIAVICYFQSSFYISFLSYWSLFKSVGALLMMIVCGLWSIKNIRHLQRVRPNVSVSATAGSVSTAAHSTTTTSKDRQLCLMLLIDVLIYTLFSLAFASYLIYQQITLPDAKNAERSQIETVISNLCQFSAAIPFCFGCYANLIVSKTFRSEIKKILWCQLN